MKKNTKMNPVNINNSEMMNMMSFLEREDVETYISEIRKFTPLKREEELELVNEIRNGNEKAFDKFVEHNLLLVVKAAKKYMHNGVPLADLIQAGNIGLITAARKYAFEIGLKDGQGNYTKNKFTSYGIWYIRKEIVYCIEEEGTIIRRPHMVNNTALKIKKAIETLDHEPTIEELSKITGENIDDIKTATTTSMTTMSTNETVDDDNEDHSETLGDLIDGNYYADDVVRKEDTHNEVEILMSSLNDKERLVIKMSYGIGYDYEHDINCIAGKLGMSIGKTKNIFDKAVEKMQKAASLIF